jgi:hypothetical protein
MSDAMDPMLRMIVPELFFSHVDILLDLGGLVVDGVADNIFFSLDILGIDVVLVVEDDVDDDEGDDVVCLGVDGAVTVLVDVLDLVVALVDAVGFFTTDLTALPILRLGGGCIGCKGIFVGVIIFASFGHWLLPPLLPLPLHSP